MYSITLTMIKIIHVKTWPFSTKNKTYNGIYGNIYFRKKVINNK